MDALAAEPDELGKWVIWMWRHWYAALRAEAAVLAGDPDASGRPAAARTVVADNPVASAIVDRAGACPAATGNGSWPRPRPRPSMPPAAAISGRGR